MEEYLSLLLELAGWHLQVASHGGDKSSCCVKFLQKIVPLFMWVLLQDSIYFTRDFPAHEVSQWLNVSSPHTVQSTVFVKYVTLIAIYYFQGQNLKTGTLSYTG
jgi:hypothetical protein